MGGWKMTHVLIDAEIVKAIGLSVVFMGVMLSIIAVGISYLIYKISKNKAKQYLKIGGLITAWAVFLVLDNFGKNMLNNYVPVFLRYSLLHLITIFIGAITIIIFLFMLSNFWKKNIFNKKLLIIVGIFAVLGVLQKFSFPYIINPYLGLLHKIIIITPPLLGFFMIIKSYINGHEGRKLND